MSTRVYNNDVLQHAVKAHFRKRGENADRPMQDPWVDVIGHDRYRVTLYNVRGVLAVYHAEVVDGKISVKEKGE